MPSAAATRMRSPKAAPDRCGQKGLSLVELMVGIAVGLFVVAAATTVVATQLSDNRRLLTEVQVQQDLRATADIITRELRRAGSWPSLIEGAAAGTWREGSEPAANTNLEDFSVISGSSSTIRFKSSSRSQGADGPYGFRLSNCVISSWLTPDTTQQLTDPNTVCIKKFEITERPASNITIPCAKPCPASATYVGNQYCWPTIKVRTLLVIITGEAVSDSSVQRTVTSEVRLRNDEVKFNNPTPAAPTSACPT